MDEEEELFEWAAQVYEPQPSISQFSEDLSKYQVHMSIDKEVTGEEKVAYLYLSKDDSRGGGR